MSLSDAWFTQMSKRAEWSGEITYTQGGQTVTITALIMRTDIMAEQSDGVVTRIKGKDFIIKRSGLPSGQAEPVRGAIIVAGGNEYEVTRPAYTEVGPSGELFRVYAQYKGASS